MTETAAYRMQQDWLRLADGRITIVEDALAQARAERKYTDARIRELITNADR